MMASTLGEEFLYERLAKIEALPPSERPGDAASLLEACRLLEEIAAALPLLSLVTRAALSSVVC